MRFGVGRGPVVLISIAAFFLILIAGVIITVRSLQGPWDRALMHRTILAELDRRPNTVWNPSPCSLEQYLDSMRMIYAREAMERSEDEAWRHKYELYFGGRKRLRRELGTGGDPIAREAYALRLRADSVLLATSVGNVPFPANRLPSDRPLGVVGRLGVYYDMHNGDVWRQTFRGGAGHRVYRLDFYHHLLLEDIRAGSFPGEHVLNFP